MIATLVIFAVWAAGIGPVRQIGFSIVGSSPSGRKAVPVVAWCWPIVTVVVAAICLAAAIEFVCEAAIGRVLGPDWGDQ